MRVANKPVVNMEPETSKRECWAVTFGNCYTDNERMASSLMVFMKLQGVTKKVKKSNYIFLHIKRVKIVL